MKRFVTAALTALVFSAKCTIIFFTLSQPALASQSSNIQVSFSQVPQTAREDFYKAVNIIQQCIVINTPIKVNVSWLPKGPTAFALYRPIRNQPHLLVSNTWYPAALSHQLYGQRDSNLDDINIFMSSKTPWYYSNKKTINAEQVDFINVAIHEIVHGLGIISSSFVESVSLQDTENPKTGVKQIDNYLSHYIRNSEALNKNKPVEQTIQLGAIGLPNAYVDYFSYSFGELKLDGTPTLYDTFIRTNSERNASGQSLLSFANPSTELAAQIKSDNNYFHGPNAIQHHGKPIPLVNGNLSHIKLDTKPSPIMTSNTGRGESVHMLDPTLIAMLKDIGWKIEPACEN